MNRFREEVVPQPPSPPPQEPPQEDTSAERQAAARERRKKLVEEARRQLRARPAVLPSAPLPPCNDDIPAGFQAELVLWERQEQDKDPFTFSFLLPNSLRKVLPLKVMDEVIAIGSRLGQKWVEEREKNPTSWGTEAADYWENKVFEVPYTVPGYKDQPLWRRRVCDISMPAWMAFCNTLPFERNNPAYMAYPRRFGVDFDATLHGRYDFPIIYNPNVVSIEHALLFNPESLDATMTRFLADFSSCPDPAFITTCNYLRLLKILLQQDPTPSERGLPPLFFDPNAIDSCAMARLMMRASLLPSFCLALLEDMNDSQFTRCNHPFLSTTSLHVRMNLKGYMQSYQFLRKSIRAPSPPHSDDES